MTLWLGDSQKQSLTFIDNDSRTLADVRLGAQGIEIGTSGTPYFDDFESRRFSYIGTLTDPGVDDPQATNQAGWFARTYQYSTTVPHAVTNVTPETGSPDTYSYDANGNMTCRIEGGVTYSQTYNAENRISSIAKRSGDCATGTIIESWSFAYDGDGVRVMTAHFTGTSGTPDSTTSYYMGGQYEVKDGATKKYYSIAGMMVAMKDGSGLQYLLTDHLGSTVAVTNSSGTLTSQQRYMPFGAPRAIPNSPILGTDFTYTGQRKFAPADGMGGIMDYRARFYAPALGRFIQPDSIIPNPANPQNWNRFSYVLNRPLVFVDPTGHLYCSADLEAEECNFIDKTYKKILRTSKGLDLDIRDEGDEPGGDKLCDKTHRRNCPTLPDPGFEEILVPLMQFTDELIQVLKNGDLYEYLLKLGLKPFSLLGRAINPIPALDFVIGFGTQALSDMNRSDLSIGQKFGRAFVVGSESGITGLASDLAGGLAFLAGEAIAPEGGGVVLAPLAAGITSLAMDGVFWDTFNQQNFEAWGLGAFP